MYGFVGNGPINLYDRVGLQAGPIGPTDPRFNPGLPGTGGGIPGPGAFDQLNPGGIRGNTGSENYTEYFNTRFPNTVSRAISAIRASIDSRVKAQLCCKKGNTIDPSGIAFGATPSKIARWGDKPESFYERNVGIGSFSFYVENVEVDWPDGSGCCGYEWKALVYIEEQTGVGPGEPLDFLEPIAGKRYVRMAAWEIEWSGDCYDSLFD